jgi:hypothetical protein
MYDFRKHIKQLKSLSIGGEPMERGRYQECTLGIESKVSAARYHTRFRIYDSDGNSKRKQVTFGLVSKLIKREANKRKAEIIAEETSQLPKILADLKSEMTFKSFYDDRSRRIGVSPTGRASPIS